MTIFYAPAGLRKSLFPALLLIFASLFAKAQPYQNGHITATFIDSTRNNRAVEVEIYYPADAAGDNVAFAGGLSNAPAIAFGHGFVMTYEAYFNVRDAVVSQGYIIAFPTTEGSLSPSHEEFGKDLAFVLRQMVVLGNSTGSVLSGKVDTFNCVMGHSMGGGAAFLAAAGDNTIKAIATLASAETTPSAIAAAGSIAAPALVFAGANDCVTLPADNQLPMYDGLASACKTYISIIGGSHCQMAESSFTCNFGESTCTPQPTITRPQQHEVIDRYLIPWLDNQLKASCTQGAIFDSAIVVDAAITYQNNCVLCPSLSVAETLKDEEAIVYPNPCEDFLQVRLAGATRTTIRIFNIAGSRLVERNITNEERLNVADLPSGLYFYEITSPGHPVVRGNFVKN